MRLSKRGERQAMLTNEGDITTWTQTNERESRELDEKVGVKTGEVFAWPGMNDQIGLGRSDGEQQIHFMFDFPNDLYVGLATQAFA